MAHSEAYWDQEYTKSTEEFDWYQQYAHLDSVMSDIEKGKSVLVAGCGTSAVGPSLAKNGRNVTCIDNSATCINAMKRDQNCNWVKGDVTDMSSSGFADGSFDYIVDKACFDSLLVTVHCSLFTIHSLCAIR